MSMICRIYQREKKRKEKKKLHIEKSALQALYYILEKAQMTHKDFQINIYTAQKIIKLFF